MANDSLDEEFLVEMISFSTDPFRISDKSFDPVI